VIALPPAIVWVQEAQPAQQPPRVDVAVEVVGKLPFQERISALTRLLGQRAATPSRYQSYKPTILELITLVNRNPQKPRNRGWDSVRALNLGYIPETRQVTVEYCIDYCTPDPEASEAHPRRKMVSYRAHENVVATRLDKRLHELTK
jgi:hypothetical protein